MATPPLILLSAAEPSGDRLGAELAQALQARGDVRLAGLAGPLMRAAGVEALARAEDLGVMGLVEVLSALPRVLSARRAIAAAIEARPAAFVGIDAPSLNLPLARRARAIGVPAIGLVAPQVWAWRRGRAAGVARSLDLLLCLFEFEPAYFPGLDARFVGHPAVERFEAIKRSPQPELVESDLIALLPGSRSQELRRMGPIFLDTAARIRAQRPQARFRLVAPPHVALPALPSYIERVDHIEAVAHARAALTKSGTATLELALLGVPMVVAHRVHPLTYALGRLLVRQIRHLALPNLLADFAGAPAPVPEFIQDLAPARLAEAVLALPEAQPVPLVALGQGGAAARAAAHILALAVPDLSTR